MPQAKRLVELIGESESNLSGGDREKVIELATMIEQIERNISRSLHFYASKSQLTLLDAQSLAAILEFNGGARLSAIAERVRMPLSTMTGVAARLEKSGLVERKRAADDGRAWVLTLTDEGTARIREMFRPFFREVAQVIDDAEPGALEAMIESFTLVNQMAERLAANIGGDQPD